MHTIYAEIDPVNQPVIVTARPTIEDYAHDVEHANGTYMDETQIRARIARADRVDAQDRILAAFHEPQGAHHRLISAEHFTDTYAADPKPYAPCSATPYCIGCKIQTEQPVENPVTMTDGFPWNSCDVWAGHTYALIIPAA